MRRAMAAVAVAAAGMMAGSLEAQQIPSRQFTGLEVGMRIRVDADRLFPERVSGTVVFVSPDSLVLDTLDMRKVERRFFPKTLLVDSVRRVTVPVHDVDSVDVSLGTSRISGMLKGARTAALIGGAIIGLTYVSGVNKLSFDNFSDGFRSGAKIGAVVGLSIGFSYGSEQWRKVGKLRPSWLGGHRKAEEEEPDRGN